jgi:oligopeptide transport system permease protein
VSGLSIFFISAPAFIIATLMQYFIAFRLGWGDIILAAETRLNWARFRSMILPILALSFFPIANMGRLLRAELSEALTSDFMLLARAKGQTYAQAIIRHALRISCVPLLGVFLGMFIFILSGSLVIEEIFSIPGIARVMVRAINVHDYQLLLAILYFYIVISLLFSIIADIGLGIIDPRIRMGGRKDE